MTESHLPSFPLPPPPPPLYCISQASPITVSIPRQATNGRPPSPLRTMAPWAPRRLSCCKASMPHRPATPLSSTWPARISIRAQVCTRLSFIQWLIWFMRLTHHPAIHLNKRQREGKGPVHPRGLLDVRCMFVALMKAFSSCLWIRGSHYPWLCICRYVLYVLGKLDLTAAKILVQLTRTYGTCVCISHSRVCSDTYVLHAP